MGQTYEIDLRRDSLLDASATRKLVSRLRGKSTDRSVVDRWRLGGLKARDGSRVKLPFVRVGGGWATTEDAVYWFIGCLDRGAEPVTERRTRPTRERAKDHDRADAILEKMGV